MSDLPTVYIEREPLEAIFAAAAEIYNKECFGFLLGRPPTGKRPYWTIEAVHIAQGVTKRSQCHVHTSEATERRLRRYWRAIGQQLIGDFHSHTAYRTPEGVVRRLQGLSETDIESMKKGPIDLPPPPLSAVVSIAEQEEVIKPWRLKARRTRLCGSLSGYHLGLSLYMLVPNADGELRPKRLVIQVAPSTRRALKRAQRR